MKLAIVCDDLIQKGGAEKVVEAVSDLFPEAPIYTSVASREWLKRYEKKRREVRTSFLQKFPFSVRLNRYYSPFLLHILAFESFNFSDFDVVLSISSRYAHFIVTKPETRHICYMNSPGRMFWEPFDYFEKENFGILKKIKFLSKPFLRLPLLYIRMLDFGAAKKVDVFLANSRIAQRRIDKYYHKSSRIVYPFVDYSVFDNVQPERGDYFLVITRLSSWKKVEIAIQACENLGQDLKIIGEGPDMGRLKKFSGLHTEFLGYVSEEDKIKAIKKCKAVVITQKEDFGIVPLEAMACGKPVIAFGSGGVEETVLPGRTGEFFQEQNYRSLSKVLEKFDFTVYDSAVCKNRARKFSRENFETEIISIVNV